MANGKQQFAVIDNGQHVRNTVAGSAEGAINSYARSTKQNSTKYLRAVAIQETYSNPKAIELLCIESIRFDAEGDAMTTVQAKAIKWSDKRLEAAIQSVEFCLSLAVDGSRDKRELWERLDELVMEQNRREDRLRGRK